MRLWEELLAREHGFVTCVPKWYNSLSIHSHAVEGIAGRCTASARFTGTCTLSHTTTTTHASVGRLWTAARTLPQDFNQAQHVPAILACWRTGSLSVGSNCSFNGLTGTRLRSLYVSPLALEPCLFPLRGEALE